jgi:hypothetical protein
MPKLTWTPGEDEGWEADAGDGLKLWVIALPPGVPGVKWGVSDPPSGGEERFWEGLADNVESGMDMAEAFCFTLRLDDEGHYVEQRG